MSWAFIKSFRPGIDYCTLLGEVRNLLQGKYSQIPQMSAGHKLNLQTPFIM